MGNSEKTLMKMQEVLDYINYQVNSCGYPPSVREICADMHFSSTATAYYYLKLLETKGLITKHPQKNRAIDVVKPIKELYDGSDTIEVPIIGTVAAGAPILAYENYMDTYRLPTSFVRTTEQVFILEIQGTSMINIGMLDGDQIIVKKQNTANNGDIVVALVDDSATVKRFYKKDGYFVLHPENDTMEDIIVKELDILGIVIALMRNL